MVIFVKENLNKYEVRTDLALDVFSDSLDSRNIDGINVTNIVLAEDKSLKIGKKPGNYITIEFDDIEDFDNAREVKRVFVSELKRLLIKKKIKSDDSCLVIGLGNEKTTPDALGPLVISNIVVTNHLYVYGQLEEGYRRVWAVSPGVMGETGIETSDLISGIVSVVKPDFIIVVDALASNSIERVNKTIQVTDAGINPGSGIGNKRKEIGYDTFGIPVIAIGVPTVVDAASIVSDTISYMYKHFAYKKANYNNPAEKLKFNVNYLNKNLKLVDIDKKMVFGMVGELSDDQVKSLLYEILNPIGYNLMVTPKEEDFLVDRLSNVIGEGLNIVLHKRVKDK